MFIVREQVCAGLERGASERQDVAGQYRVVRIEGMGSNPEVVRRDGGPFSTEVGSDSPKSVRRRERDWDKLHKAIR